MDFTQLFLNVANTFPEFKEAVGIVKANSEGHVWLIGGFVCRSIIQELYHVPVSKDADFDFLVEKPKPIKLPPGWEMKKNSYGNPKLVGPAHDIDYVPLNTVHSIIRRNLEPTIENFLSGTPLNVQSIVYDLTDNKIIGEIGIKSIKDKIIAVNDKEQAEYRAKKKGITVKDFIIDIAKQFGFMPIY